MKQPQHQTSRGGFTIIELMIATAVFSVVLLLCTYAVLSIGRAYYRGVITTRTQETARGIMEEITDSIRFGGAEVTKLEDHDGVEAFCIGQLQFSYRLDTQLVERPSVGGDKRPEDEPAPEPETGTAYKVFNKHKPCYGLADVSAMDKSGTELLRLRMRLDKLSIDAVPGSPGIYKVVVRVIHGEKDLLEGATGEQVCKQERAGSEYCAVSELSTIVERRT